MRLTPFVRPSIGFRAVAVLVSMGLVVPMLGAQTPEVSKLAGSWGWTWNDRDGKSHKHLLEVEGVGKALAAREIFDDLPPKKVTELTFNGEAVAFKVTRGEHQAEYRGKLADEATINGTVTVTTAGQATEFPWKATRRKPMPPDEPAPKKPE